MTLEMMLEMSRLFLAEANRAQDETTEYEMLLTHDAIEDAIDRRLNENAAWGMTP